MNLIDAMAMALALDLEVPKGVTGQENGAWTQAVYSFLKEYATECGWRIYPEEKPYRGEYHCDFTLFEDGYGCRLACESQWLTHRSDVNELRWAFDKLRGVKADVKLYVFEAEIDWIEALRDYLERYAQLTKGEIFVFLRWNHTTFERFWWVPQQSGLQQQPFAPRSF